MESDVEYKIKCSAWYDKTQDQIGESVVSFKMPSLHGGGWLCHKIWHLGFGIRGESELYTSYIFITCIFSSICLGFLTVEPITGTATETIHVFVASEFHNNTEISYSYFSEDKNGKRILLGEL